MNAQDALNKLITAAGNADGLLPPDKARTFMSWVMDESVLRGNSRIYGMSTNTYEAPYLLLGDIFEEGTEGTSPTTEGSVDTGLIPLTAKEIVGKVFITDMFIEDNIETSGFFTTLAMEMAKAYANKEDDIFFNSTETGTGLYGLWDGFLAKAAASSHRKNLASDTIDLGYMSDCIKLLPQKWTRNRKALRFYTGPQIAQDITELLSQRPTPLGDTTVASGAQITIYGVPLISATAIAENNSAGSGTTSDHGRVVLTPVNNTIVGDRRLYKIERERRPRQRGTWLVPSARVGFNVETVDALSDLYYVKVAP